MKFWKVGSRKIYAVKSSEMKMKRKFPADTSSSSDSDVPRSKVIKSGQPPYVEMQKNLKEINNKVSALFEINRTLQIPLGMRKVLIENFKCVMCHNIIRPPVIFTRCCKYMLGCERCVHTWYKGDDSLSKTCPRCRADRGYADTCRVNGLDDFLIGISKLLDDDSTATSTEPSPST